jgi:hypothetical protein
VRNREDYRVPRDYQLHGDDAQDSEEYDAVAYEDAGEDSASGNYAADEDWAAENPGESWSDAPADSAPSWSQRDAQYGSHASFAEETPNTPLVRLLRIPASLLEAAQPALSTLRRAALRAYMAVVPNLHKRLVGVPLVKSTLRGVGARPRRSVGQKTTERSPIWTRGLGRLALLAVLMIGCGMLLVYAMAPAAPSDESAAQHVSQPEATEQTENASTDPAAAAQQAASEAEAPAQGTRGKAGPPLAAAADPTALSFGAKAVPNAQRYLIRMRDPVKALHGKADARGFVVDVLGSSAIDRAAPIAAGNRAVAKASILNKGTHAELIVRFAEGKSPAFRVTAQQAGLEVLIGP